MECDLQFQLKLPDFVERPLQDFIDQSYQIVESTRTELGAALPLQCLPAEYQSAAAAGRSPAEAITEQLKEQLRSIIIKEAQEWLVVTSIKTIISSLPSGGVSGVAALATSVGEFIERVHTAVEPILTFVEDTKELAENVGFSTSCGWSDWHPL